MIAVPGLHTMLDNIASIVLDGRAGSLMGGSAQKETCYEVTGSENVGHRGLEKKFGCLVRVSRVSRLDCSAVIPKRGTARGNELMQTITDVVVLVVVVNRDRNVHLVSHTDVLVDQVKIQVELVV